MFPLYFFTTIAASCLAGQIIAFRLYWSRSRNRIYRAAVIVVFLLFNALWALTLYRLVKRVPFGDLFLNFAARPAISWQTAHILIVLPLCVLAVLVRDLVRLMAYVYVRLKGARSVFFGRADGGGAEGADLAKEALEACKRRGDGAGGEAENVSGRRDFLKTTGSAALGTVLIFSTYAVWRQSTAPLVKKIALNVSGLPGELDGFTIAHLTDHHVGRWASERDVHLAFSGAAREKPDLVVVTGDMVDRNPSSAEMFLRPMEDHFKRVPYGVYGVLGNHDHFVDADRTEKNLSACGIRMLREERVNIKGLPLSLTGLDDQGGGLSHGFRRRKSADEDRLDILSFNGVKGPALREDDFKILLNHRPEGFRQAAHLGYGLYLAGHTHGGQYAIPGFPQANAARMIYKYTSGLYHEHGSYLNVSCGLASVGIPFRFGAWPELSLITLKRA
ncbi:MAG: metallophosphoesterase [Deltaproteobacteria bacterium]|jgi:predicted MPP superfamily phosphohydrolase|nr:metallophosphoesterase [Deltaproteobacteria bacterium]